MTSPAMSSGSARAAGGWSCPSPISNRSVDVMELVSRAAEFALAVHHFFVKFSDTLAHVGEFDSWVGEGMLNALIAFWSHALAAACSPR